MAGKGAVALAADIAAHARVDLHVLLERALGLEALPTQETENSHVRACGRQQRERVSKTEIQGQTRNPIPLPTHIRSNSGAAQAVQCGLGTVNVAKWCPVSMRPKD